VALVHQVSFVMSTANAAARHGGADPVTERRCWWIDF
jgi:hypothetical protein